MTIHTDIQLTSSDEIGMRWLTEFGVVNLGADSVVYPASAEQARKISAAFANLADVMDAVTAMAKGTAADPDAPSFPVAFPAEALDKLTIRTDPAATSRFESTFNAAAVEHGILRGRIVDRTDHLDRETDCDQRHRQDEDDRWGVTR